MRFVLFLVLSGFVSSQLATAEEVNCHITTIEEFVPSNGGSKTTSVQRQKLHATRQKTMDGTTEVYRTNGELMNENKEVIYSYRALRRTDSTVLPNGNVVEKSTIESTRYFEGSGKVKTETYETEAVFQVLLDGTRKEISFQRDGETIPVDMGVSFSLKSLDGVSFESYYNDKPEVFEGPDGRYTTVLSKQICQIQN